MAIQSFALRMTRGNAHASRVENMAPFEMPVEKTRRGSMHSERFVWRNIGLPESPYPPLEATPQEGRR